LREFYAALGGMALAVLVIRSIWGLGPHSPSSTPQTPTSLDGWWSNTAESQFAHLDYTRVKSSREHWKASWLDRWVQLNRADPNWLRGARIGDYGTGAGLLGKVLCEDHAIGRYIGMDIAARSLSATARFLEPSISCPRTLVLVSGEPEFKSLNLDALISQQVIQHFPSREYTAKWLHAIEEARIPHVFLEVRYSDMPVFNEWNVRDATQDEVSFATKLNCQWMSSFLSSYRLADSFFTAEGESPSTDHISRFQGCAFEL